MSNVYLLGGLSDEWLRTLAPDCKCEPARYEARIDEELAPDGMSMTFTYRPHACVHCGRSWLISVTMTNPRKLGVITGISSGENE